jgi:hypothetical protein
MRWDSDGDHDFTSGKRAMGLLLGLWPFHASVTRSFIPAASNRFICLEDLRNIRSLMIYCRTVEMAGEFKHSSAQVGLIGMVLK